MIAYPRAPHLRSCYVVRISCSGRFAYEDQRLAAETTLQYYIRATGIWARIRGSRIVVRFQIALLDAFRRSFVAYA